MESDELVSIIIPTYYRNDQLRQAIESAQNQTYEPIEIIVVDDSGERYAESVCSDLDVRYVAHETNRGGNPARNSGIEAANGEYLQLLDDDDRLDAEKIQRQVDLLASSSNTGVVYCGLEDRGNPVFPKPHIRGDVYHEALKIDEVHPCQTGTMLIETEVMERIYPLTARKAADDIGMRIRLARETRFDFVDEILFYKGESDDHRARNPGFTDEIRNIIEENRTGYESAPPSVYREAMKVYYTSRGHLRIQESNWSWDAIRSFWRALQYSNQIDPVLFGAFVMAWFGAPGHRAGSIFYTIAQKFV